LASSSFGDGGGENLAVDDGSGEMTHDVIPQADRIDEAVVDNNDNGLLPSAAEPEAADIKPQPHWTQMMPYASIVLSRQSHSQRMSESYYYHSD